METSEEVDRQRYALEVFEPICSCLEIDRSKGARFRFELKRPAIMLTGVPMFRGLGAYPSSPGSGVLAAGRPALDPNSDQSLEET